MKKAVSMLAASGIIAILCVGCGKAKKPVPAEAAPKAEAVAQPKESRAKQWEPETAEQPKAHDVNDGGDHSGHNH